MSVRFFRSAALVLSLSCGCATTPAPAPAPCPTVPPPQTAQSARAELTSWRPGPTRQAIESFVANVTDPSSPDFVPVAERVAVFDNDGTLWSEQPLYFQVLFVVDEIRALSPRHPEWSTEEPFASVLKGDVHGALAQGKDALVKLVTLPHAGMSTTQYATRVAAWLREARHPTLKRPYTELVFQPMLELLQYLRERGFKTFLVSGGEVGFMRVFAERVYGVPPEQVIGTRVAARYALQDGTPAVLREPSLQFYDDAENKPIAIETLIGRRPVMAFGNSNGDLQMLQWTRARSGRSFVAFVHHTDAEREWAYDRQSSIGRLDVGLDQAVADGWTLIDVARDWAVVFAPSPAQR